MSDWSQSDIGPLRERLAEGDWLIVLYRDDCPHCQKAMPKFKDFARRSAADPTSPRLAMIEVPPYGAANSLPVLFDKKPFLGRLSDAQEWFVQTPVEAVIKHARVVHGQAVERTGK